MSESHVLARQTSHIGFGHDIEFVLQHRTDACTYNPCSRGSTSWNSHGPRAAPGNSETSLLVTWRRHNSTAMVRRNVPVINPRIKRWIRPPHPHHDPVLDIRRTSILTGLNLTAMEMLKGMGVTQNMKLGIGQGRRVIENPEADREFLRQLSKLDTPPSPQKCCTKLKAIIR